MLTSRSLKLHFLSNTPVLLNIVLTFQITAKRRVTSWRLLLLVGHSQLPGSYIYLILSKQGYTQYRSFGSQKVWQALGSGSLLCSVARTRLLHRGNWSRFVETGFCVCVFGFVFFK